jgi:hypothetical protein
LQFEVEGAVGSAGLRLSLAAIATDGKVTEHNSNAAENTKGFADFIKAILRPETFLPDERFGIWWALTGSNR